MSNPTINTGGPAFPVFPTDNHAGVDYGMTLRDYFAAKAIPTCINLAHNQDGSWDEVSVAVAAYAVADAMIAERAKV